MSKVTASHTDDTAKIEITLQQLKEIIRDVVRAEIERLIEESTADIHYPAKKGNLEELPMFDIGVWPEEFNTLSREELYDDPAL
jgi:hypothetical protein